MYLYRYELPWSHSSPCLLFKVIGCSISEAFAQDVSQSEIVVPGQQSRFRAPQPQETRRLFHHQFQKPKEKCGSLSPPFSTVSCFYVPTVHPIPSTSFSVPLSKRTSACWAAAHKGHTKCRTFCPTARSRNILRSKLRAQATLGTSECPGQTTKPQLSEWTRVKLVILPNRQLETVPHSIIMWYIYIYILYIYVYTHGCRISRTNFQSHRAEDHMARTGGASRDRNVSHQVVANSHYNYIWFWNHEKRQRNNNINKTSW